MSRLQRCGAAIVVLTIGVTTVACGGSSATDGTVVVTGSASVDRTVPTSDPTPGDAPAELIAGGRVTDEAVAAAVDDDQVSQVVVDGVVAELAAMPEDERFVVLADLSRRLELELARVSGLQDAIGDDAATVGALDQAWAPIGAALGDVVEVPVGSTTEPAGFRGAGFRSVAPASQPTTGTVALVGFALGARGVGETAGTVVSAADRLEPGKSVKGKISDGITYEGEVGKSVLTMDLDSVQDGVAVKFTVAMVVYPCPGPDGRFDITVSVKVQTSKGNAGSNGTIDMKINGQVDDDARLANADVTTRAQWADFANARGQYFDLSIERVRGETSTVLNRFGGTLTPGFTGLAALVSAAVSSSIEADVLKAAEAAWSSGRCVALEVTPSDGPDGLEPSAVVSVLAEPRSKLDGAPTGGSVTATLANGGASVDPDGSPVPADATSNYTAPDEQDQSGTVRYESRSRRGVGKAELTFTTAEPAAYTIVGGLDDWQVNQVVCDVMEPFTLTSSIGTMELSGGLSGTYLFTGQFNSRFEGTYVITLPDGPGAAGTMVGGGGGTVAGQYGSGSESYVLTPATC